MWQGQIAGSCAPWLDSFGVFAHIAAQYAIQPSNTRAGTMTTLPPTQTLYFEDLSPGMSETYSKEVKSSDVIGFAEISGDRNPIHLSEHFAAQTPFKGRIAHGLYTASLISAVIGTRLPGPGAIYLQQTLNFRAPVRIGDTVIARVEVVELSEKGNRVKLACTCAVGDTLVLEGDALVKVPGRDDD
jgi:3-hydroxybutyryl-CoA dehydratase